MSVIFRAIADNERYDFPIDTDNAVNLDVEASRSVRLAELGAMQTMLDRTKDTFDIDPERIIADTAYGTGPLLEWLVEERGIAPHIPVVDKSGRTDGTFERADFTYDDESDLYVCPGGKELKQSRRAYTNPTLIQEHQGQISMAFYATAPAKLIAIIVN